MHMHSTDGKPAKKPSGRWGKPYRDMRNWKEYNEELVIRGKFFFDLDFADQWDSELNAMNKGKRGSPYLFPESFMQFMNAVPDRGVITIIWYYSKIHK